MANIGYTLMTEQSAPGDLVRYASLAEELGFDFEVSSDHFTPWLVEQGHSPNAWVLLGAVANATSRVELMTYVTCPTMRYHPAVVAQQAATLQQLSAGRFVLNVGSGESLNEHVIGEGWPSVDVRQSMLEEAITIIRELHTGDLVTWEGEYYRVDSARVWDAASVPIGVAISGPEGIERFATLGDHAVAVQPDGELVEAWDAARGAPSRKIGQVPVCWGPDKDEAIRLAHEQFRWTGLGWAVNAELPTPASFAAATASTSPEQVAESVACGPDLDELAQAVQPYLDAGFTDIAIVQVGDELQDRFLAEAAGPLLEKIRAL
jgi:G6PDH family F420-dependent oxidoreductase